VNLWQSIGEALTQNELMTINQNEQEIIYEFEKYTGLAQQEYDDQTAPGKDTDICQAWLENRCERGDLCQYRHSRSKSLIVCKHWLRGLCKKGIECEFVHRFELDKMPECFFFSRYGECTNDECMYRHVVADSRRMECPFYARGFCKHGPRCRYKHVQKVACANYLGGFCPKGPACRFGHAKFEIDLQQVLHEAERFGDRSVSWR